MGQWRIELFGVLTARQGDLAISRFRTQKTASLLAYLAFYRDGLHPREQLVEILWPDVDPDRGRTSLRTSLASLRRQFEPPGVQFGTAISANAEAIQLNPSAVTTDVAEFLESLSAASNTEGEDRKELLLKRAVSLYRGELLAGLYDDWIVIERRRLLEANLDSLRSLTRFHAEHRDYVSAKQFAEKALQADAFREESHRDLMRLYAAMGRPSAAMAQFAELDKLLREHGGTAPSAASRELAQRISSAANPATNFTQSRPSRTIPDQEATKDVSGAPRAHLRPSLPLTLSRFFGRNLELAALTEALAPNGHNGANRLFTLTGPGGVGKTRTAIETARSLQDTYGGRVWYVPLADTYSVDQITGAIAESLSLKRSGTAPVVDEVAAILGAEPSLLVLDNFEQVAEKGPSVVSALLARARPLKALVTSRRRLALDGEREYPLSPLTVPGTEAEPTALLQIPSVQLFVDRAQAVRPDFQLTTGNARSVSEICRILEGIPLAIELAAARSQVLTPARMVEKLAERFKVLSAIRDDRVARHRSLWAAIDWSYRLLSPEHQRFFCGLSVFRGGCTAEAAEQVCGEPRALEYLTALRVHSLVATMESGDDMRFVMLETLREFAGEQLGEDTGEYRERHARIYASMAETAKPHLEGAQQAEWLAQLDVENANLREAFGTLVDRRKGRDVLRMSLALWRFWWVRGETEEASRWLEQSLALAGDASPRERADVMQRLGNLAWRKGESEKAVGLYQESLSISEAQGDRLAAARSLGSIGNACRQLERTGEAQEAYEQSLAIFQELNDANGAATSLLNLGTVFEDRKDYEEALRLFSEGLKAYRDIGDLNGVCVTLSILGNHFILRNRASEARSYLDECAQISIKLNNRPMIGEVLSLSAGLAMLDDDPKRAAVLVGASEMYHSKYGLPIIGKFRRDLDRITRSASERIGAAELDAARGAGQALSTEAALELALCEPPRGRNSR